MLQMLSGSFSGARLDLQVMKLGDAKVLVMVDACAWCVGTGASQ